MVLKQNINYNLFIEEVVSMGEVVGDMNYWGGISNWK
jgi:hypothetical protein